MKYNAFEVIRLAHIYLHHPLLQNMVECECLLKQMAKHFPGAVNSLVASPCYSVAYKFK